MVVRCAGAHALVTILQRFACNHAGQCRARIEHLVAEHVFAVRSAGALALLASSNVAARGRNFNLVDIGTPTRIHIAVGVPRRRQG